MPFLWNFEFRSVFISRSTESEIPWIGVHCNSDLGFLKREVFVYFSFDKIELRFSNSGVFSRSTGKKIHWIMIQFKPRVFWSSVFVYFSLKLNGADCAFLIDLLRDVLLQLENFRRIRVFIFFERWISMW